MVLLYRDVVVFLQYFGGKDKYSVRNGAARLTVYLRLENTKGHTKPAV